MHQRLIPADGIQPRLKAAALIRPTVLGGYYGKSIKHHIFRIFRIIDIAKDEKCQLLLVALQQDAQIILIAVAKKSCIYDLILFIIDCSTIRVFILYRVLARKALKKDQPSQSLLYKGINQRCKCAAECNHT